MVREAHVEVAGRRVRFLQAGAGWPVVLLHAFPVSADMWRPQLDRVPQGWRFLAPDLRGFGPCSFASGSMSLNDMAEDVSAFLDAVEIDNAVIGGLSMGGYVTMALNRAMPDRFTAMLLANTKATADSPEARAAREEMASLVLREGASAVANLMLPKLLGETSRHARPYLEPLVRRLIEGNSAAGLEAAIQAVKDRPDSMLTLENTAVPALVIAGDEDEVIPIAESEAMHQVMPRSQLVVLECAGHLSNLEVPDDFSEALGNFLRANL